MSKRRRSYSTRARQDRLPDDGIAAQFGKRDYSGLIVLNTPYRRLIFFAGLTGILVVLIATAVAT